jgi:hypothetical protein
MRVLDKDRERKSNSKIEMKKERVKNERIVGDRKRKIWKVGKKNKKKVSAGVEISCASLFSSLYSL